MDDIRNADRERMAALARDFDVMAATCDALASTRHQQGERSSAAWWHECSTDCRTSAARVREEMVARQSTEVV